MIVTRYGIGGYDPTKPNNNIVGTYEIPDDPAEVERDDAALRLRQSYQALRQFADDAAVVAAQGTNVTQAQHKALFDRFGKLCDGLADLLVHLRVNG